jgi:hypothetical protein
MARKKWLTTLDEQEVKWIKEVASEAGLSGGFVISELIAREMRDKNSRFRKELGDAKLRLELQKLNDEEMVIQAKRQELTKRMKTDRVLQPA